MWFFEWQTFQKKELLGSNRWQNTRDSDVWVREHDPSYFSFQNNKQKALFILYILLD